MPRRYTVETPVDVSILGESLTFPTSKRVTRNRLMKAALSEYLAPWTPNDLAKTGTPNSRHVNMYEKWSAGGYGVVLTGGILVDKDHLEAPGNTIISADVDSPEKRAVWAEVATKSKAHGGLIVAQIMHAGRQTQAAVNPHPFAVSTKALGKTEVGRAFGTPVEMTTEQVKTEVVDKFIYTAKYLYDAGFDGIQLHCAHGYLLAQFLSRTTNKRTDQYGGSEINRARVIIEIYEGIRKLIPAKTGFIIGVKLNSVEFQNEGLQTNEAVIIAQELDKAGFDFIELSGGTYEKFAFETRESTKNREAFFFEFAKEIVPSIKNAVVYLTGGFRTAPAMVSAIKDGVTQGIGIGRPATQEFDFVNKLLAGKVQSTVAWSDLLPPSDFTTAVLACSVQTAQAGQKALSECADINEGISDLTDDTVAAEYLEAQKKYIERATAEGKQGRIVYGIVPFRNNYKQG
uniref:Oxidored_FMN domain-containing protein n=1 Tax=Panagrellus redivivus TaxID=6233 RepID=A0A7E4VGC4_PANRE